MAVNQSQVDHILSTASADDPEVKLQTLQDEVDLLKKSVKKLLIDLREKMNEADNPFIISTIAPPVAAELPEKPKEEIKEEKKVESPEPEITLPQTEVKEKEAIVPVKEPEKAITKREIDSDILASLNKRYEEIRATAQSVPPETIQAEKPKLQKLHHLFEWVSKMVKKYGHDRLEIMIGTYFKMGYISDEACKQIKEMAKLMPESIGDFHEVSSEEFISELYLLNKILLPEDSSLDREMIEVIMEKKESKDKETKKLTTDDSGFEEDWIEMLEKI